MRRWWLVAALLSLPVVASAARVAGVELQEQATVGNRGLSLNGAGLRRKVFFNVYVVGLYLTEKRQSAAEVLAIHGTNQPKTVGRAVSHGCVRMRNEDIAKLYAMVPVGTPVYIY